MVKKEIKNIVSFYKIDLSLFDNKLSNQDIIQEIMQKANDFSKETQLSISQDNGFNISMYYLHKKVNYSKWESFFSEILNQPNDTFNIQNSQNKFWGNYLSFICFFEKGKSIFTLCMGKGYTAIEFFIENDFGFNLLTRLIKPESNFLKQTVANHLSGVTFEDISFFRSSESFISQDDFGKIFKQAISQLDKEALKKIGIQQADLEKTNCIAKSSFMLKTGISLNQITKKILPALIKILNTNSSINFQINKVKLINKNHLQYKDLEQILFEKIRTNFLEFDLFSPEDSTDFFMAEEYSISRYGKNYNFKKGYEDLTNIENVKKILDDQHLLDFKDQRSFLVELPYIKINAYDDQANAILRRSFTLTRGLHGEIEYKGNRYFWMNGKFWLIDKDFLEYFSDAVFEKINQQAYKLSIKIPFKVFDLKNNESEDSYNKSHETIKGFFNLDKKMPYGVEVCDLLYETTDTIYLIHIKKGFDRNIRDLTSQILTAEKFLFEDINKNTYLEKVYSYGGVKNLGNKKDFLKKFKKKTVFVFAFINDKNIFDIAEFKKLNSNIAKLELSELLKEFKKFSPPYDLKIIQLPSI